VTFQNFENIFVFWPAFWMEKASFMENKNISRHNGGGG